MPWVHPWIFRLFTGANSLEAKEYARARKNLKSVGVKTPLTLGLDTSLAQVGLSLAKRNLDPYATKSEYFEKNPRRNDLEKYPADSKPAVWWNLKYKTRWLSDGSIVSGNPIFTNFLWNEIGRGTDLKELEGWLKSNKQTVMELTASVFATKSPHWTDFFKPETISIEKARKGEKIFKQTCQKCHGQYVKNWDDSSLSYQEQLKTKTVIYHKKTPVKNVGTDPYRWQGMQYFAGRLNDLSISKWMKTVVEPQEGYVPPPLVGVWMRYPYFHNGSVPNLCSLFMAPKLRPRVFWQGPANNPDVDFTKECVGYPIGDDIPRSWKKNSEIKVDTTRKGLSPEGNYKMFLTEEGKEKYSWEQKLQLIEFLKTL